MNRIFALCFGVAALVLSGFVTSRSSGQQPPPPTTVPMPPKTSVAPDSPDKRFEDFAAVTKGAKEYDGLFKLHHKDDKLYMEIQLFQFDRPLLAPIAIARGVGMGGYTLNFDEQWVLLFRRVGDRVHLIRRNVRFQARPGTPTARAVETTYTDSVLLSLRIISLNMMRDSVVINLNDIFMTDFAQLGLGFFDQSRSTWHKIKAFPRNLELQVAATYGGRGMGRAMFGDDSVIDSRGTTVVIHYSLVQLPESGYQPRLADDRVGHFLSVVKDFSNDSRDTAFLRYVNRWRLERAEPLDPKNPNKLSPPKKRIVYWIEKSVPDEYRSAVREGILEWNKAFEKIGFRDAIEVRQQEDEDFDPEDVRYSTFRWITTGEAFAMGPSRANPLTGEIIDADIIFDADFVRYWKQEYRTFRGIPGAAAREEPASPIQALRQGWGLPDFRQPLGDLRLGFGAPRGWNDRAGRPEAEPATEQVENHFRAVQFGLCQCAAHKKYELGLGAIALAARTMIKPGEKVPEDLILQAIKEVVMHEVGHTLGLRHNFKASTMLKNEQLHDQGITRKQGLVGSVMDYAPINLAPKGTKQGDYFTTTIGPYDYWAIEYAYRPQTGTTESEWAELQKIAARCAQQGLDYGPDEDMFGTSDPLIQAFDLGADPMKFAQERMLLAEELLKDLAERLVDKGEGYQKTRQAFNLLLAQHGNAAFLVAQFVGAEHIHRDHRGDSNRDPLVPVKAAKQREALKLLQEHILTDRPFQFPPQLLRKLAADRWWHWGNEGVAFSNVEFPLHERILAIQRVVLRHMYNPAVLARIQNNTFKADKDEQPLTVAEVFRTLTDSIWKDYQTSATKPDAKQYPPGSLLRRNLQREHLSDLSNLVLGRRYGSVPADARSLARLHLRDIQRRIDTALKQNANGVDETTRAHLEECQERIVRVLGASMTVSEP